MHWSSLGFRKSRNAKPRRGFRGLVIILSVSFSIVQSRSLFPFAMHPLNRNKESAIYSCMLHGNKAMMSISTIHGNAQQEESPYDRRRGRSDGIGATQKQRWRWLGDVGVCLQEYHIQIHR